MGVLFRRKTSSARKLESPYFTWGCADNLQERLRKTLYVGEEQNCFDSTPSVALTDFAVSMYLAAAPSPKRKLTPNYASSVARRIAISPCTLMMGILYSERLRQANQQYLHKISSSDLFVMSLIVASKYLNDEGEDDEIFNDEWAEASGLAICTVNRLEREFLDALEWNAYVGPEEFFNFCSNLETRIALKNGLLRGWFSYTDLTQFMKMRHYQETLNQIMENTMKVMTGCALLYGLSVGVLTSSVICYNAIKTHTSGTGNNLSMSSDVNDSINPFTNRPLTRKRNTTYQESYVVDGTSEGIFTTESASSMRCNISRSLGKQDTVYDFPALSNPSEFNCSYFQSNDQLNQSHKDFLEDPRNPPRTNVFDLWAQALQNYGLYSSSKQPHRSVKTGDNRLLNIPPGRISSKFVDGIRNEHSQDLMNRNYIRTLLETRSMPCNLILAGKGTSECLLTSPYPILFPCVS